MTVELQRESVTDAGTIGRLAIDGVFQCYTLEPGGDEQAHPAIPAGAYGVIITPSLRFKRLLPLIVGVRGRTGIRVHPGNDDDDTEGCLLLGEHRIGALLLGSRAACEAFQHAIAMPLASGEPVAISVHDPAGEAA